jgi:hypothetical protein
MYQTTCCASAQKCLKKVKVPQNETSRYAGVDSRSYFDFSKSIESNKMLRGILNFPVLEEWQPYLNLGVTVYHPGVGDFKFPCSTGLVPVF